MCWHAVDVERLIEEDHPARAIWELVGRLDLTSFLVPIGSVQGQAGRPAFDPHLLVSLWLYAYSRGIGSAREIARRCEYEPPFQWLTGLDVVNHHILSDFRIEHREALDELLSQVLAVLSAEGLITLERVMHDGTKIHANAGQSSFCSKERIEKHLEIARQHVVAMGEPCADVPDVRRRKAQERARRERKERLGLALNEYERIRAAKRPGYNRPSKQQTGASISDPEARIMRHSASPCALSYNVQISTDAAAGIVVSVDTSQTAPDYEHLVPAVKQIERRLGSLPKQIVVDAGYTSRENVLALDQMRCKHVWAVDRYGWQGSATVRALRRHTRFSAPGIPLRSHHKHFFMPRGQDSQAAPCRTAAWAHDGALSSECLRLQKLPPTRELLFREHAVRPFHRRYDGASSRDRLSGELSQSRRSDRLAPTLSGCRVCECLAQGKDGPPALSCAGASEGPRGSSLGRADL